MAEFDVYRLSFQRIGDYRRYNLTINILSLFCLNLPNILIIVKHLHDTIRYFNFYVKYLFLEIKIILSNKKYVLGKLYLLKK